MLTNKDLDKIADKISAGLDFDRLADECVTEYPNGMVQVDLQKLQSLLSEFLNATA